MLLNLFAMSYMFGLFHIMFTCACKCACKIICICRTVSISIIVTVQYYICDSIEDSHICYIFENLRKGNFVDLEVHVQ